MFYLNYVYFHNWSLYHYWFATKIFRNRLINLYVQKTYFKTCSIDYPFTFKVFNNIWYFFQTEIIKQLKWIKSEGRFKGVKRVNREKLPVTEFPFLLFFLSNNCEEIKTSLSIVIYLLHYTIILHYYLLHTELTSKPQ